MTTVTQRANYNVKYVDYGEFAKKITQAYHIKLNSNQGEKKGKLFAGCNVLIAMEEAQKIQVIDLQ